MFCTHCGNELPEGAYFCIKCGVRTIKGVEEGIPTPWNLEYELEKAFSTAVKETKKVFKSVKESVKRSIEREPIVCPQCRVKNLYGSKFCSMCGKEVV